jgi:molybdopterin molybdotransferase
MQEETRVDSEWPDQVCILDQVKPWENVRLQGEDVKCGTALFAGGERLNPARAGLLAAVGLADVCVGRRPRVGLLATGSELVEAGQPLPPGKVYESNRVMLAGQVERIGATPDILPLVPDDFAATRKALSGALAECDALVTSGGVSVGEFDFVRKAFEETGGCLDFWQVSIRPGKPFVFGRAEGAFLFGLPGNPVSAWVTFMLLVRPALLRMQGAAELGLPERTAVLAEPLVNRGNRRHFMRVAIDHDGQVRPTGTQASHILSSLANANGLVEVPPGVTYSSGATVQVFYWD